MNPSCLMYHALEQIVMPILKNRHAAENRPIECPKINCSIFYSKHWMTIGRESADLEGNFLPT